MPATGDFRTILLQIKELKQAFGVENLQTITEAVNVVDGNITMFGDELFKRLDAFEERLNAKIEANMKPLEERILSLETKISELCNESSYESEGSVFTPPSSKRRKVKRNPDLSHHVRSKLSALDLSWDTTKKITDPENQAVVTRLLREVSEVDAIKNNVLCTERRIKDAITSTYKTAKKRDKRVAQGEEEAYKKKQRKVQRMDRKLKRRMQSLNHEEKNGEKGKAVHMSLMSSDESGDDNKIFNRPLTWRNEDLSEFFKELDSRHNSSLNPVQRRMLAQKMEGNVSERNSDNVPESLKFWVNDDGQS